MAESPDYQPIDFTPYPPTQTSYVTAHIFGTLTSVADTVIYEITSHNLWVIKTLTVRGTMSNKDTTNSGLGSIAVTLTKGLDNGGTRAYLDGAYYDIPIATSALQWTTVPFELIAPTPLVVTSGNLGSPNQVTVRVDGIGTTFSMAFAATLVMWPLS